MRRIYQNIYKIAEEDWLGKIKIYKIREVDIIF